jgi:hypothetical protein
MLWRQPPVMLMDGCDVSFPGLHIHACYVLFCRMNMNVDAPEKIDTFLERVFED